MKQGLLLVAALALASCGQKIDTSSPDAYSKSVSAMVKGMPPEKQAEFKEALVAITFDTADPKTGIWSNADPSAPIFMGAKDKISGLTPDAVIKLGYQIRIRLLDQKIAEDAASAQRFRDARAKVSDVFEGVHIDGAQYKVSRNVLGMYDPEVVFRVTNGSKHALKAINLQGVLTSPGRSVPWISSSISYEFPGGIEPGESKALDLEPNMFGDWKADDTFSHRSDLHLNLTLVNATGPDGTPLIDETLMNTASATAEATKLQGQRNELAGKLAKL